jgi:glycosyltransferase involved in cell wall biosynthesis
MLVGGSKAATFLEGRGVPAERILPFRYLHPDLAQRPVDRAIVDRLAEIKRGRIAFLYLGRAMHRKGLVPLIRAFRGLLDGGRDAVLFVVGEAIADDTGRGGVSTDYVAEARRLAEGESRIVFFGHVQPTAVNSYYAGGDVFVHPHVATVNGADVHEGWGQVITEAACMSKPIVTTDRVASAFDIVIPDRTGYLIDAERIDAELPAALARFVDRPALVGELGRRARARFEEFVDPRLNVASIETLIERGRVR